MTFRHRRDTSANWAAVNPVVPDGQLTYDETANALRMGDGVTAWSALSPIGGGGGGVSDGDKGDITVSGGGASWTIDAGVVTLSQMADLATSTILGRATAGTGSPEALTATQVRTILNVASGAGISQLASTISDFATAVSATAAVTANTAKVTNATHTGDVTGATALTIANDAVTNTKLANMAANSIKGNNTGATADPSDLTAAQVRTLINVADGATANASDAALRDRTSHTGTQAAGTITGLAAVATSGSASDLGAGTLPAARFDDTAHGARAGGTLHAIAVAAGAAGFMTGADKTKLDGIAAGAQVNVPTNLTYTAATRVIASDTGADATLPLVTTGDAGLAPASGGGTANFLRADGTWAAPAGGGGSITVQDEGSNITTGLTTLNFTGAGVTVTGGATATVTIPGGGGGGYDPTLGWAF